MNRSRNRITVFEAAAAGERGNRSAEVESKLSAQSMSFSTSRQTLSLRSRRSWSRERRCLSRPEIACGRFPPERPTGCLGWVSGAVPRNTGVVGEKMMYPCSNFKRARAVPSVTSTAFNAASPRSGLVLSCERGDRPTNLVSSSSHRSVLNLQAGAGSLKGLCNETSYLAPEACAPK